MKEQKSALTIIVFLIDFIYHDHLFRNSITGLSDQCGPDIEEPLLTIILRDNVANYKFKAFALDGALCQGLGIISVAQYLAFCFNIFSFQRDKKCCFENKIYFLNGNY